MDSRESDGSPYKKHFRKGNMSVEAALSSIELNCVVSTMKKEVLSVLDAAATKKRRIRNNFSEEIYI